MVLLLAAVSGLWKYFIIVVLCVATSNALLFSVLMGNPPHLDPFLAITCRPIRSSSNARVRCAYNYASLECTQTCNAGYALADGTSTASLSCTSTESWKNGREFQTCRATIVPGTGVTGGVVNPGAGSGSNKCISAVTDCPADGDYADCHSCDHFISCAPDGVFLRRCPPTTQWDDIKKQCTTVSTTCLVS